MVLKYKKQSKICRIEQNWMFNYKNLTKWDTEIYEIELDGELTY